MMTSLSLDVIRKKNARDALCEGSETAFRQFIKEYQFPLQRFVFGMIRVSTAAEDIVHDSFVELWEKFIRKQIKIHNPEALIFHIVHCRSVDYLRRERVRQLFRLKFTPTSTNQTPLVIYSQKEDDKILFNALQQLRIKDREIILLFYEECLPLSQIASILHLSEEAASSRLRRARKCLHDLIPDYILEEWSLNHEEE